MRVHHLEARHGDTAFAFLVLRLRKACDRDAIVAVIGKIAPMIPDADAFIAELPEDLEETMRIVGMPWLPADDEVHIAKFWATDGAHRVVHAAQHLHGGVGFDLETPIHRYFRWAKVLEFQLGSGNEHLRALGASIASTPA